MQIETAVRKNFIKSSGLIAFSFLFNALLNLLLIGWLSSQGGMALVGIWAFFNMVLTTVIILDLGLTKSLTRTVALNGTKSAIGVIIHLIKKSIFFLSIITGIIVFLTLFNLDKFTIFIALFLTLLAGVLQLFSNWIISLRLGEHEQYWFNAKIVVRIALQSMAAFLLYKNYPQHPELAFGMALFIGGFGELMVTFILIFKYKKLWKSRNEKIVTHKDVQDLLKGFAVLTTLERSQQPIWQALVFYIAGPVALGTFVIALRLPLVCKSAISESLRVLLPGITQLKESKNDESVSRLLTDGILIQTLILAPAIIFFISICGQFLLVWLGDVNTNLILTTQIISIAVLIQSPSVPFIWALQAFGDASKLALCVFASLFVIIVFGGFSLYLFDQKVIAFSAMLAVSFTVQCILILYIAEKHSDLFTNCLKRLSFLAIFFLMCVSVILAVIGQLLFPSAPPLIRVMISAFFYAAVYCPLLFFFFQKKLFYNRNLKVLK